MKKIRVFFLLLALALLADQSFAQCPTFSRRNNGAGGTCSSFDVGNIPAGKVHAGRFTFTNNSPAINYRLTKVTINGVLVQEGSTIYSGTKWFGSYNGTSKDLCFYGNNQNDNAAPAGNWKLYFLDPTIGQTYICSFIFDADGSQSNFNPGVIGSDQSICTGSTPATLTSSSAASGNAGTLTYQWQQSTTSAADGFTNISGATSATYSPGALTQTTYFQRIANDGTTISASSNVITVTVTAPPSSGTLSGTQTICGTGTTTFASTVSGGTWSSSNTSIATVNASTGVVTGVAAGTATITYTVAGSGGCSNATATRTVTVTAAPSAGTLAGTQNICVGGTTSFSSSVAGGTWSSSATSIATISSSGVITGVAAGTATITYSVAGTDGCTGTTATATRTVTVTAAPSAGTLGGTQSICVGGTTTFTSTVSGGAWSSSATSIATVNASTGVVTGVAAGTATITYTVAGSGGCSDVTATRTITVATTLSAGTLSGTQTVCTGATTTFSSTVGGGTWSSSSTSVATINSSTGVITGVAAGTATMTYTIAGSGGCSNATATRTVTVSATPTINPVSNQVVCNGATTSAINFSPLGNSGYQWMTANSVTASSATGTGQNGITFNVTQSGGGMQSFTGMYSSNRFPTTYNIPQSTATISNTAAGTFTVTFSQPVTNPLVAFASVGSPILSVPVIVSRSFTPIWTDNATAGWTTTYDLPNNTFTGTEGYNIIRIDGTFTSVSFNYTIAETFCTIAIGFEDQNTSYNWTNSQPSIGLAASGTGNILPFTAVNTGTTPIVANLSVTPSTASCTGTAENFTITVNPSPNPGTLSGTQAICVAGTSQFSSTVTGGTWSSSNTSIATVNATTGVVTGVAAGTATITYTIAGTGGCANGTATRTVTVTAAPIAGSLSGTQIICGTGTTTFTSTVSGGTWSSSNTSIATVNATSGVITGITAGTATITYSVAGSGGCAAATVTRTVTVSALPAAAVITVTQTTCAVSTGTITVTSPTGAGYTYSVNNGAYQSSAIFSGLAAGSYSIRVKDVNGCVSGTATTATINTQPATPATPGAITGNATISNGSTQTYQVSAVTGATSYTWTLPNGWTGSSSTNSITVVANNTSGTISVVANANGCTSAASTLAITVTVITDSDGDGIPDSIEGTGDADGDGIPNYLDLDSDGDGIPDSIEVGPNPNNPRDSDGDGTPDYLDVDSDGDGIPDSLEDAGCSGTAPCTPTDTDGDGTPNYLDLDSDGDGIPDSVEDAGCSGTAPCTPTDTDGDGTPNYLDLDSDGDGIPDSIEAGSNPSSPRDSDNDGTPDYLDLDSDGDGIPDSLEDAGCNGTAPCTPTDTDGDGTPNYLDLDSDGDGIPDSLEDAGCNGTAPCTPTDTDGDGTPNYLDLDSDGDGIPDSIEDAGCNGTAPCTPTDTDGDGTPNYLDLDSDNDGIPDSIEDAGCNGTAPCTPTDTDGDGTPNYLDLDSDNDGIPDSVEDAGCNGTAPCTPTDTDGDGTPNYLDLDSDNDGIPDSIEAGPNPSTPRDSDNDGTPDYLDLDSDNDGIPDSIEDAGCNGTAPCTPTDTDGDGTPNYLDLDSDNDGIPDSIEDAGCNGTAPCTPTDTDGDGTPNYLDLDSDNDGIPDSLEDAGCNGTAPCTPTDTDGDGVPNYLDLDSDNDGILDSVEDSGCNGTAPCTPTDTDGDGTPNYLDLDSDGDGCSDANEAYNSLTAQGTDGNMYYGAGNPPTVNANGQVVGATYPSPGSNYTTAGAAPVITAGPTGVLSSVGATVSFSATATVSVGSINYQWQVSTNAGVSWTSIPTLSPYSGVQTPVLTINGVTAALQGYRYRLIASQNGFICGADTSASATLTVNFPPDAVNDVVSVAEDVAITGNLLTNDTDPNNDPLTVTSFVVNGYTYFPGTTAVIPGVGSILINANGTYTFTPLPNYNGTVPPITYTISDGQGGTDTANLNITVTPVNDAPDANNDTATTLEDTPVSGNVLTNDTDVDGNPLTVTQFTIAGVTGTFTAGQTATIPGVGTLVINANGTYTFTPAPNYNGPVPVATYTVSDGQGGTDTATLSLSITPVNDNPNAVNDTATTLEDTPVSGNVLTNDTDIDGNSLSVTNFVVGGITYPAGATALIPGVGTILINSNGSYVFTPAPNYNGTVPPIQYYISDGQGGTDTANLNITVTPVNDAPDANNDTATTLEDTPVSGNVLTNDTDVDGNPLTVTQFTIAGVTGTFTAGQTATIPGVGTLVINANGTYTFTPAPNYNGPVPVATYTVSDGQGGTDTATLSLSITPVNDNPNAVNDTGTTLEDQPLNGNVLSNDTDVDGNPLAVTQFVIGGINYPAGSTATIPGVGTILINSNGSYVFTPAPNYNGTVPPIQYYISDGQGGTASATLQITVQSVADPEDIQIISAPVCISGTVTMQASTTTVAAPVFRWYSDATLTNLLATGASYTTPVINSTTNYYVTVSGTNVLANLAGNAKVAIAVILPAPARPTISASGPLTFCKDDSVTLKSSAASSYQWYKNGSPISGATTDTYVAKTEGDYTVVITNSNGCASAPSLVAAVRVPCTKGIYMPTVFTPNKDGKNDVVKPSVPGMKKFECYKIYNRWGNLVFECYTELKGWDGTFKGVLQPAETYIWVVQGQDGQGKPMRETGMITLMR